MTAFSDVFRFLVFVKTCYHLLINHLRLLGINPQAKITFFVITIGMAIPTGINTLIWPRNLCIVQLATILEPLSYNPTEISFTVKLCTKSNDPPQKWQHSKSWDLKLKFTCFEKQIMEITETSWTKIISHLPKMTLVTTWTIYYWYSVWWT